ncbi:DNA polymerase epsilon subunit 4 [Myotis brandtii]|uniref:DNA polymerase epsilon subunit 4 n=1 Tax=Myotis brandtii TaxID=109478 RepID=S7MDZ4_MYOBR|nr:DNA polymerase epsilon subunit 4 [Myotis brandtii]
MEGEDADWLVEIPHSPVGREGKLFMPQAPTSAPGARLSRLPLARVKALVKADPDVTLAGQEAIFILARAAELFVETIAKDAYCCAQQGKRKTLQRRDLDNAIEAVDEFAFLEEVSLFTYEKAEAERS